MLSRTADHLYWIARYVERAENVARILESAYQMSLMPIGGSRDGSEWEAALAVGGDANAFQERYGTVGVGTVVGYMALDLDNPSSIRSSIGKARENARETRHLLSTELWESINQTWLELQQLTYPRLMERGFSEFFEWVRDRSHLFRGVAVGTVRRGDAFSFMGLGTFVERADNTARVLDVKYRLLSGADDGTEAAVDYYRWGALLKALSAFKSYREIYRGAIAPRNVAELLVLREDVPRSLHACTDKTRAILERLNREGECARVAGRLHGELHYGLIDEILDSGLSEYLGSFVARNAGLNAQIQEDFMMTA